MNARAPILAPFPGPCQKAAVTLPSDLLAVWLEAATIMPAPGSSAATPSLPGWGVKRLQEAWVMC